MSKKSTTSVQRCFVAFAAPVFETTEALITQLKTLAHNDKYRLRIVPHENFHITLKFIGNVETDQIGLLDSILRNQTTKQTAFQLNCHGLGFFNNALYLGIEESKELKQFVSKLNEAFSFLGYAIESQEFLPHITLARFDESVAPELATLLDAHRKQEWGSVLVESIHLYRSETLAEGAKYTSVCSYPLAS